MKSRGVSAFVTLMAMTRKTPLPEPWEDMGRVDPEEFDALESTVGSRLTLDDLTEDDTQRRDDSGLGEPRSRKSWIVMGRRWVKVRNKESGLEVLLRLQTFDGSTITISSMALPFRAEETELTGADLRSVPVAALAAAYSYDEQAGRANLATFLELVQHYTEGTEPLDPLPPAENSPKFAALVARQFLTIEDADPKVYVAQKMADLNEKPLPTVQRWITQARRAGFLPPARTGRRRSG